jgi:intracellular septation protein
VKDVFSRKLWINLLCEFGPIAAFLTSYEIYGFGTATLAMIVATIISFVILFTVEKHPPYFALVNTLSVLLFGGISVFVSIPDIFILRDTAFDIVLGVFFLASLRYQNRRTGLEFFFSNVFAITKKGWREFTFRWGIFYIVLAFTNETIRIFATPDMWVEAKVWMIIGTVVFGFYQLRLTARERLPEANAFGLKI